MSNIICINPSIVTSELCNKTDPNDTRGYILDMTEESLIDHAVDVTDRLWVVSQIAESRRDDPNILELIRAIASYETQGG